MSIYLLPIGAVAVGVFIAGMVIGYPLIQRRAQARADAMVGHLLSGLAPDPGEIRSHRRPREWNDRPVPKPRHELMAVPVTAHVPAHACDAVAGWDTFTYLGRHAYGKIRPIVDIEARAAYDAAVLTVQAIIRSVHSGGRELVGAGR